MNESRRGEVIERRLRALVGQRLAWDSVALVLFSLAMAGALLLLVVSLFWSGWVMFLLLVPVGMLVWQLARQNRFWHVARLVEERFPEARGKLVAAMQLARWGRGAEQTKSEVRVQKAEVQPRKQGTVPRSGCVKLAAVQSPFSRRKDIRRR